MYHSEAACALKKWVLRNHSLEPVSCYMELHALNHCISMCTNFILTALSFLDVTPGKWTHAFLVTVLLLKECLKLVSEWVFTKELTSEVLWESMMAIWPVWHPLAAQNWDRWTVTFERWHNTFELVCGIVIWYTKLSVFEHLPAATSCTTPEAVSEVCRWTRHKLVTPGYCILALISRLFPWGFPIKILYAFHIRL